jgi:hypothetical protein
MLVLNIPFKIEYLSLWWGGGRICTFALPLINRQYQTKSIIKGCSFSVASEETVFFQIFKYLLHTQERALRISSMKTVICRYFWNDTYS